VDPDRDCSVPIALGLRRRQPTAWLLGSLWSLKLAQNSPGSRPAGAACSCSEARPLASVLALFLIVLFLSSAACMCWRRMSSPRRSALYRRRCGGRGDVDHHRYGDEVPAHPSGAPARRAFVMICGIATFGLWTGIPGHRFRRPKARRQFIQTWDLVSRCLFPDAPTGRRC